MKRCNNCKINKKLDEFYFRTDRQRHINICKNCKSKIGKVYREQNKEKLVEKNRRYYNKIKQKKPKEYDIIKNYVINWEDGKYCSKCNIYKEYKYFNRRKCKNSLLISSSCKDCIEISNKKWREKNREYDRKRKQKWLKTNNGYNSTIKARMKRKENMKEAKIIPISKENYTIIYNSKCVYCNSVGTKDNPITIDHIIPLNKKGNHELSNLVSACRFCNISKNDIILEEWCYKKNLCILMIRNNINEMQKKYIKTNAD